MVHKFMGHVMEEDGLDQLRVMIAQRVSFSRDDGMVGDVMQSIHNCNTWFLVKSGKDG